MVSAQPVVESHDTLGPPRGCSSVRQRTRIAQESTINIPIKQTNTQINRGITGVIEYVIKFISKGAYVEYVATCRGVVRVRNYRAPFRFSSDNPLASAGCRILLSRPSPPKGISAPSLVSANGIWTRVLISESSRRT